MTISEVDANYLLDIYSGRLANKNRKYDKQTEAVSAMNSTDKIYIFPNCKIKKLPLRKYIKHIGAKQVFKPEEATCLVVKKNLTTDSYWSRTAFRIMNWWKIPAGRYVNESEYHQRPNIHECSEDTWVNTSRMESFIFRLYIAKREYESSNWQEDEEVQKLMRDGDWENEYRVEFNQKQLNETHLNALNDRNTKLINELDLQQVVYNWEVDDDIRDDLSDYSWSALYDLLSSPNSWDLAIAMIRKGNVESMMSKLVACLFDKKVEYEAKLALYDKVFIRNPGLYRSIDRRVLRRVGWNVWHLSDLFNNLKDNDVELDPQGFKDVLNIVIRYDEKDREVHVEQLDT